MSCHANLAALRAALSRRVSLFLLGAAVMIVALTPLSASACAVWSVADDASSEPLTPGDLPEALVMTMLRCGSDEKAVAVWTLKVDADAEYLGIRDAELFQTSNTGPLKQIAAASIPGAARVTIFERANAATSIAARGEPAYPYRRFVTFCDDVPTGGVAASPLDCSLSGMRIKARATAQDTDLDGVLDMVKHEISLYLAGDKLHVVFYAEPYRESALSGAATWIDVLTGFGILQPGA